MGFLDKAKKAAEKSVEAAKAVQDKADQFQEQKQQALEQQGILHKLKSLEGSVTLFNDRLEMKSLTGTKNHTIPYNKITSVHMKKTGALKKSAAATMTAGLSLAATKKTLVINAGGLPLEIDFRTEKLSSINKAIAVITERSNSSTNMNNFPTQQTVVNSAPLSDADELKKLADLRDSGILTEEEFLAKKNQILGL